MLTVEIPRIEWILQILPYQILKTNPEIPILPLLKPLTPTMESSLKQARGENIKNQET